jgi:hypothetical protein
MKTRFSLFYREFHPLFYRLVVLKVQNFPEFRFEQMNSKHKKVRQKLKKNAKMNILSQTSPTIDSVYRF